MNEIRKRFPLKPIIAYSSHQYKIDKIEKSIDLQIDKDLDLSDWINILDDLIRSLCSPKQQWNKARNILLMNDVDIYLVAELETDFVKSLKNRNIDTMQKSKNLKKLENFLLPVLQGLSSKLILEGVKGFL